MSNFNVILRNSLVTRPIVRLITQHKIPLVHRPLLLAKLKGTSSRLPCSASTLYSFRAIYSCIYPRGILSFDQRRHIGDDAARCSSFRDWRSWREVKEIMGWAVRWRRRKRRTTMRPERERNGRNRSVERGTCAVIWRRMHHRLCHLTRVIERDTAVWSWFVYSRNRLRIASVRLVTQGRRRARVPRRVLISEVEARRKRKMRAFRG